MCPSAWSRRISPPAIARSLDISPTAGLCEVLRGEHTLDAAKQGVGAMAVVTAGAAHREVARLLLQLSRDDPFHRPDSARGLVIVDLPPLSGDGYGTRAAEVADAVILVVRAGMAPVSLVRAMIARLARPPRGIVFNAERSAIPGHRGG